MVNKNGFFFNNYVYYVYYTYALNLLKLWIDRLIKNVDLCFLRDKYLLLQKYCEMNGTQPHFLAIKMHACRRAYLNDDMHSREELFFIGFFPL